MGPTGPFRKRGETKVQCWAHKLPLAWLVVGGMLSVARLGGDSVSAGRSEGCEPLSTGPKSVHSGW